MNQLRQWASCASEPVVSEPVALVSQLHQWASCASEPVAPVSQLHQWTSCASEPVVSEPVALVSKLHRLRQCRDLNVYELLSNICKYTKSERYSHIEWISFVSIGQNVKLKHVWTMVLSLWNERWTKYPPPVSQKFTKAGYATDFQRDDAKYIYILVLKNVDR